MIAGTIRRRPELTLLAALLLLAAALAARALEARLAPPAPAARQPAPAPLEPGDPRLVAQLEAHLRQHPGDGAAYAALGQALLQQARETGDGALYGRAEAAFAAALARDPASLDATIGQGQLALARHDFAAALAHGEAAARLNPFRAQAYGVIGDALVELGRYDEAVTAVQRMVDLRPDLASYSRVSYLRELHGDVEGAVAAMEQAVLAGRPGAEATLWALVQLGNLHAGQGDYERAEGAYRRALSFRPAYPHALAGVARVAAAAGRYDEAIAGYEAAAAALPAPEFVVALAELYAAAGRPDDALAQRGLARAMQRLNAAAGMDVDMELARFEADVGEDPARALALARAAYDRRPGVYGADTLAWALLGAGQVAEARRYSAEALRLGTRDAALHYHAGTIALAAGDRAAAREHLAAALAINPTFSVRDAAEARRLLAALNDGDQP